MEVVIEHYDALPCGLKKFTVNGIEADLEDFGEVQCGSVGDYECVVDGFDAKLPSNEVLAKYKISVDEYAELVAKLNTAFDYGYCNWCD